MYVRTVCNNMANHFIQHTRHHIQHVQQQSYHHRIRIYRVVIQRIIIQHHNSTQLMAIIILDNLVQRNRIMVVIIMINIVAIIIQLDIHRMLVHQVQVVVKHFMFQRVCQVWKYIVFFAILSSLFKHKTHYIFSCIFFY